MGVILLCVVLGLFILTSFGLILVMAFSSPELLDRAGVTWGRRRDDDPHQHE